MKSRPILFSGPMVRALLAGTKTQTRRIMKPQPSAHWTPMQEIVEIHGRDRNGDLNPEIVKGHGLCSYDGEEGYACPYGITDDRLWVRESFRRFINLEDPERTLVTEYAADEPPDRLMDDGDGCTVENKDGTERSFPFKPSIHMPRILSRITLEITNFQAQRLQDISEEDARAEGHPDTHSDPDPITWYHTLWESINGAGSWDLNPWVWALTLKRVTA